MEESFMPNRKLQEYLILAEISSQKEMIEKLGVSNYTVIKILCGEPVRLFAANRFSLGLHQLLIARGKRDKDAPLLTPEDLGIKINPINSPGRPRRNRVDVSQSTLPSPPSLAQSA